MTDILLTTLNARYIHCSLGLRYLRANLGEFKERSQLKEFIIDTRPIDIVEQMLSHRPKIVSLGVYIWNIEQSTQVVALLKRIAPEIIVVIGGPEVSYEHEGQEIVKLADYVICGPGEKCFYELCKTLLRGSQPLQKILPSQNGPLSELTLPYDEYTDEDIAHRIIYVEASRGCPFKCEFCLSSLDKTAKAFDIDLFLNEMAKLYARGARHFKFVDRTFNLKIEHSIRIMQFFRLQCADAFLHFELIPDHLPDALKAEIAAFADGQLQFEIGIQSFNPEVQTLISRKQNNEKSCENIRWLRTQSHAHLHTDLILGLPGEDLASIAQGFNKLYALDPHEIQVGILKRLKGTPIIRHTEPFKMRYNPHPPYTILATDRIDFPTMQRLNRFARYWDLIANAGRFPHTLPLLLRDQPFEHFMALSDWLHDTTGQTHKIALPRLFELLHQALIDVFHLPRSECEEKLLLDFARSGIKGYPKFIANAHNGSAERESKTTSMQRQARHRQASHRKES